MLIPAVMVHVVVVFTLLARHFGLSVRCGERREDAATNRRVRVSRGVTAAECEV